MARDQGKPLLIVHVVHETVESLGMYRRHHGDTDTTPILEIARGMLEERVARFRETCGETQPLPTLRTMVIEGVPESRIPELARHFEASMIVMCSHNRHGVSRWWHGSVTEAVKRRAPCPVVFADNHARPPRARPAGRAGSAGAVQRT
jgi:nucleotide-binding universal stress UspA family protein